MPHWDFNEFHSTRIAAAPPATYRAVRNLDLARSLTVRALFAARGFGIWSSITFEDLVDRGFALLGERQNSEFVLGVIGEFWRPAGRLQPVSQGGFQRNHPGLAKAVWNFQVAEDGPGTVLSTETRVFCPDESTRKQFSRYWRIVSPFSAFIRLKALEIAKSEAESATPD